MVCFEVPLDPHAAMLVITVRAMMIAVGFPILGFITLHSPRFPASDSSFTGDSNLTLVRRKQATPALGNSTLFKWH
jgi:hypothetical protein